MEPIIIAAIEGDLNQVKYFLDQGVPIDLRGNSGFTPLHHAVARGHFELAEFLIDNKSDLNAKTCNGATPLKLAVCGGHFDIFELLIDRGALNCSNSERIELLNSACLYGYLPGVKFLADEKCDLNAPTAEGETPILLAASRSHELVVEFLVHSGVRLNCFDRHNRTVLHYSSEGGWLGVVRSVLERNEININLRDIYGISPLLLAASRKRREVFDVLLESGAELLSQDESRNSVFHFAVRWEWVDIVEKCVKKYPTLNVVDEDNLTPLMIACRFGITKILRVLLEAGANSIFRNRFKKSALTHAIKSRVEDLNVFKLLIKYGAFPEFSDYNPIKNNCRFFKEYILKDAELCTQMILNKFNNKDLPTALKLSPGKHPSVERLEITNGINKKVPEQIEEAVIHEIEAKKYCDVTVFRPMVLQMLAVQSISSSKQYSPLKRLETQSVDIGCTSIKRICSS